LTVVISFFPVAHIARGFSAIIRNNFLIIDLSFQTAGGFLAACQLPIACISEQAVLFPPGAFCLRRISVGKLFVLVYIPPVSFLLWVSLLFEQGFLGDPAVFAGRRIRFLIAAILVFLHDSQQCEQLIPGLSPVSVE
jgi:hypothetical protein